jgi:uncharacterized protein YuzE
MIKFSYDQQTDIFDIKFSDEKIIDSEFVEESGLVVDYDENNKIVGIEILSFSKKTAENPELKTLAS